MTSRSWCVTYNNPPADFKLPTPEKGKFRYAVWQEEIGESGTHHLQMYIELNDAVRHTQLQKDLFGGVKVHCEKRKGTREQARAYCMKKETQFDGPFEVGVWTGGQGDRTDVKALIELVQGGATEMQCWDQYPDTMIRNYKGIMHYKLLYKAQEKRIAPEIVVLWGDSGTGKTHDAELELKSPFRKEQGPWWDGYDGQSDVLIDEFTGGHMPYGVALRVLDKYNCSVQVKGGTVPFVASKIVITSNLSPVDWYSDKFDKVPLLRRLTRIIHYTRTPLGVLKTDQTATLKTQHGPTSFPVPPFSAVSLPQIVPSQSSTLPEELQE